MLVANNFDCKVCDFGLAGLLRAREPSEIGSETKERENTSSLGTLAWTAPELFEDGDFTTSSDVYAFGVIMFEVLIQKPPFEGTLNHSIPYMVSMGRRPYDKVEFKEINESSNGGGEKVVALMKQCCNPDPQERPSFKTIGETLDEIGMEHCGGEEWISKVSEGRDASNIAATENTNSRFAINPADLTLGPKLGAGNFGTVYEAIYQGTNVAAKEMIVARMTQQAKDEFYKECSLMERCRHPNIGTCYNIGKCHLFI